MAPEVVVDGEVYEYLKARAEPFVDTPNTVLRRILGLEPPDAVDDEAAHAGEPVDGRHDEGSGETPARRVRRESRPRTKWARAPRGALLPGTEYEIPILEALVEAKGSAPTAEVIETVGRKLSDRLTTLDRQPLQSGGLRWRSRIQFVRLRLVERGLVAKGSPPGTWAITEAGRQFLTETDGIVRA